MTKRQGGFSIIEVLAVIVALVIVSSAGLYIYRHQSSASDKKTNNAYISLRSSTTDSKRQTYIDVDFKDSVTNEGCSSTTVSGFQGNVKFSYDDTGAVFNITQNKPSPKKQSSSTSRLCAGPDVARASQDIIKRVSLNQQWIENKSATKTITINGEPWKLILDKSAYSLEFSGAEGQRSVQPYLPTDVAEITTPKSCMTNAEMAGYIANHGIETAEQKYPGINSAYLKLNPSYNKGNRNALVITNQYVKSLPLSSYDCNNVQLIEDPGSSGGPLGPIALPLYKED